MKLEHVALYVSDLEKAREFFITYFGAASNAMYHNPRTGLRTYFLSFGDGYYESCVRAFEDNIIEITE